MSITPLNLAAALLFAMALTPPAGAQDHFNFGVKLLERDIDAEAIPPDGKNLPPGSGGYTEGKEVYQTACAACHGADLMGVAGLPDMPSGAALRLIGGRGTLATRNPIPTVESYWPFATTLFDYVRRAMPLTAPGSLTDGQVYAVAAFILAEGNIIDKSAVMDAATLPKVRMPNRDGFIPDPRPPSR
jgi:cytochrome c